MKNGCWSTCKPAGTHAANLQPDEIQRVQQFFSRRLALLQARPAATGGASMITPGATVGAASTTGAAVVGRLASTTGVPPCRQGDGSLWERHNAPEPPGPVTLVRSLTTNEPVTHDLTITYRSFASSYNHYTSQLNYQNFSPSAPNRSHSPYLSPAHTPPKKRLRPTIPPIFSPGELGKLARKCAKLLVQEGWAQFIQNHHHH